MTPDPSSAHPPLETQRSGLESQPASSEVAAEVARRHGAGGVLDRVLVVGSGISDDEVGNVRASLDGLSARLKPLDDGSLEVETWVRKRDTADQVVYLAVRAGGGVDLVANSRAASFHDALIELKQRMRRQLADHHDRQRDHRRR